MKTKILMVCLGNICRSPLAEGILASKLDPELYFIDSAGTSGHHNGELPDRRSIAIAREHGLNLTNQRSRKFVKEDFEDFDYIYVMDNSNYRDVVSLANSEEQKNKVDRIMNAVFPGENVDVPDPYYGGNDGFKHVYKMLDDACNIIVTKLS
ncbi:MAG: low molecular weight phosphotyrosine protein phosphatase [Flavobacteriaceae bacterium]|nr:low molecular weight phosphotyrosine protein phosphatase [Flavobacteriaceae bacterium]